MMLGEKQILRVAVSISLESFFSDSGRGYSLCKGGLYYHALGAAIIAELLANFTGKIFPGVAYTAGLLHDIGKVVLDQYIPHSGKIFHESLFYKGSRIIVRKVWLQKYRDIPINMSQ